MSETMQQSTGLSGQFFFLGEELDTLGKAKSLLAARVADATFSASTLNYGAGTGWGDTCFEDFLGVDAASLATDRPDQQLDQFAVTLTGYIYLEAGSYDFRTVSDDGFELVIGGEVIASFEDLRAPGESAGSGTFAAGLYEVQITYFDNLGGSVLQVEGFRDGGTENIFETGILFQTPDDYFGSAEAEQHTDDAGRAYLAEPAQRAPELQPDTAEISVGERLVVDVLANDMDADGDDLWLSYVYQPSGTGFVMVNDDWKTLTYIARGGFEGTETFTYKANDGNGNYVAEEVTVTVRTGTGGPVGIDDDYGRVEAGTTFTIDASWLFENDDLAGGTGTLIGARNYDHRLQVSLNEETQEIEVTAFYDGETVIAYAFYDGNGGYSTADIHLTVGGPVTPPDDDGTPDNGGDDDGDDDGPATPEPVADGVLNPSGAINLSPLQDWGTALPMLDLMKQSREWIVTEDGSWWGGIDMAEVRDAGLVDANGYISGMPDGAWRITNILLHESASANPEVTAGEYTLRYKGEGTINLQGYGLEVLSESDGEIVFQLAGDVHSIMLHIDGTDPNGTGNYLHDISVVKSDYLDLHDAGQIFNPEWLDLIEDFRVIRFMDWMDTNGNEIVEFGETNSAEHYTWRGNGGVPLEVMVELANQAGVDPWFTIPFHASDDYVRAFAQYLKDHLDPELKAHVEFSNEVWNYSYGFPQTAEADALGLELFGDQFGDYPHRQYYGYRAAEVLDIMAGVFGEDASDRLVKIMATQTRNDDWPAWTAVQGAEVYAAETGQDVSGLFDQLAGTWYFGGELGNGAFADQVLGWVEQFGENRAIDMIFEQLSGETVHIDLTGMDPWVANPSIDTVLDWIGIQADFAAQYGWELTSYEGGSHMVGVGAYMDLMEDLFVRVHQDPRLGELYQQIHEGWAAIDNTTVLNQFWEVGSHDRWGSFSALRDLRDSSARWDVLLEANGDPADWEERSETAFDQGRTLLGDDADEILEGTSEEDFLIGKGGDDVLHGFGGADGLHGGAGNDILVGGGGTDLLIGGAGADLFVFAEGDTGMDVIADFKAGDGDRLDLSGWLAGFDPETEALSDHVTLRLEDGGTIVSILSNGETIDLVRLEDATGLPDLADFIQTEASLLA